MASLVSRRLFLPSQLRVASLGTMAAKNSTNQRTKAKGDPVQQLFLDKLQEYKAKKKGDKIPDLSPQTEKDYQDQLERLKRIYGGKTEDMTTFPKFEFEEK